MTHGNASQGREQAPDPTIVKIMTTQAHRAMSNVIYKPIWSMRKGAVAKRLKQTESDGDPRVVSPVGSIYHDVGRKIYAIADAWRCHLGRIHFMPEDERPLPPKTLLSMRRCLMAGVILDPKPTEHDVITCKKYAVCPFCRYRKGLGLIEELTPALTAHPLIAQTSIYYPVDVGQMTETTRDQVRRLVRRICKHNGRWKQDVVITVPAWGKFTLRWYYRISIIAFSAVRDAYRPPDTLVQTIDWDPVPPVGSSPWDVRSCSPKVLRLFVGRSLEYSPGLLSQSLPPHQFALMAKTTEFFRVKQHGAL